MSQCATNAGNQDGLLQSVPDNNKNKKRRILRRIFMSLGVFFCFLALILFLFKVSPACETFTVELGDPITTDINDYLVGRNFALRSAKLEMPEIIPGAPGEYKVFVKYFWITFEYSLIIEDTHAPKAEFSVDNFVCEVGKETDALYFISSVEDKCTKLTYEYINTESDNDVIISDDKYCFIATTPGVHNVTLKITDLSGNYSTYYFSCVCDIAPVIEGITEYYTSTDAFPDLLSGVYAYDSDGYDVEVTYKCPGSAFSVPGDYTFTYSATDYLGLTSTKKALLHTYSPLSLQDLVNTKQLDSSNDNVFGILNPYDSGYIQESNIDEAIELMKTAVIRIQYDTGYSRTNGSGYIVKIDSDNIVICTNSHVVKQQEKVYVSFFDGITVKAEVVASQSAPDVAFVKVPTLSIPQSTLDGLKTVHINLSYYDSLSDNPNFDMGMYCINSDGSEWIKRTGKIVRKSGMLSEYFVGYDYAVTEVSIPLTPGVSGSAIIDTHGNLLCMASFYWKHDDTVEYYGVSLNDILDFYEKSFGERLEYY